MYYVSRSLSDCTRREGGLVMCDGDHAAEGAVVRVTGCYRLLSWLAGFGRRRRKDRGRSEGRRLLTGCGHRYHELMYSAIVRWAVGVHRCHVMLVAGRGGSLSDPRKERVRFQAGPRFWGTYWPCPLPAVLRIRNPFSSPQLSFYHGAAIGVWDIHQCRGPALHAQSGPPQHIRSDHLRAPRTTRRLLHGSDGSQSDCPGARVPARAEKPGV